MHSEGKMSRSVSTLLSSLVKSQFLLLVMMLTQCTAITADHIFHNYNIFPKKKKALIH